MLSSTCKTAPTDDKMGEAIGGQTLDHGGITCTWGFESMGWIRNFSANQL